MAAVKSLIRACQMDPKELKELFGLSTLPASSDELDPNNLPFETVNEFSCETLGFEEAGKRLWDHMILINTHAIYYNRQSPYYTVFCKYLERDVRTAGSFCLTKAVLEKKGFSFPSLKNMKIEVLLATTAYHFRKCAQAFEDIYEKAGLVSLPMHTWELSFYRLSERLKATADKIKNIKDGKINVDRILQTAEAIEKEEAQKDNKNKAASKIKPMQMYEGSLPIFGSYAAQLMAERREEEHVRRINDKIMRFCEREDLRDAREELAEKRRKERERQKAERAARKNASHEEKKEPQKAEIREEIRKKENQPLPGVDMTVQELRTWLIEEAKKRERPDLALRYMGAPPEMLVEAWKDYVQKETKPERRSPDLKKKKKKRKK